MAATAEPTVTDRDGQRRIALALALLVAAVLAPWVQMYTAQPRARFVMTATLAEEHTFEVTDRADALTDRDRAEEGGRIYGDKAPGQPVMAVPVFLVAKAAGFADDIEYRTTQCCVQEEFVAEYHLGVWWIGLFFAVLPACALCALMYRHVAATYPERAVPAALSMSLGTLLLPFGTRLYGHVLAAALCFAAWHLIRTLEPTARASLASGALAGLAVSVEYSAGIVLVILAVALLVNRQPASALRFTLASVPFGLLLAWYHTALFGGPLRTSYGTKSFEQIGFPPKPGQTLTILFGPRGFIYTPIVFVGLVGLVLLFRRGGQLRREALTVGAVFLGFLVLQSCWVNPWGGATPGPRYMIPALPFLALPVAAAWHRLWGTAATIIGFTSMSLATITLHYIYDPARLISGHLQNLRNYGMSPTIFGIWLTDPLGLAITAGLVALATWHLTRTVRSSTPRPTAPKTDIATNDAL